MGTTRTWCVMSQPCSPAVDMPLDEGPLLAAIAAEGGVQTVIATHWHPDHWMTYDAVRAATGAPVLVGSSEIKIPRSGSTAARRRARSPSAARESFVLHTPGHTRAASRCASVEP